MTRMPLYLLLAALLPSAASAEPLRYAGTLTDDGQPAEGTYVLRVSVYDAPSGGLRVGPETTLPNVEVRDGRFEAEIDLDLPPAMRTDRWLQVEVAASDGEPFEALPGRQSLDPKAVNAGVCWDTRGNSGTDPTTDFLGTTDATGLTLRVGNQAALRILPPGDRPNIVMGASTNTIATGVFAGTIGGGGTASSPNTIAVSFGTVCGGEGNQISGGYGTIGGGRGNRILGPGTAQVVGGGTFNVAAGLNATVPGGIVNLAGGDYSFAAGLGAKVRGATAIDAVPGSGVVGGDAGTFVWSDGTADFISSGPKQFLIGAHGGVAINRAPSNPNVELTIHGRANDAFAGNVDVVLIPSANGTSGEGIALAAGIGGAGSNDAVFTIAQRDNAAFVPRFRIDGDGTTRNTTGAWSTLSDARIKRNIEVIPNPLATVLALRGQLFEYTETAPPGMHDGKRMGFIAQDVRRVIPGWVREGTDGYLSITPTGFEALVVEAMRELAEENALLRNDNEMLQRVTEGLRKDNVALRKDLGSLGQRLARIEQSLRRDER